VARSRSNSDAQANACFLEKHGATRQVIGRWRDAPLSQGVLPSVHGKARISIGHFAAR